MSATIEATRTLKDPELKRRLQGLRATDNWTNWLYIGRAYAVIATAMAVTIGGFVALESAGLGWWWNLPVLALAVAAIGASQHQLAGATHEATHHTLFKNRKLNELASDWLCMFPLFSSTHTFRLHHLAHHQFINDPERDPDYSQLRSSGHWMNFPISKFDFLWMLFKQLWVVSLVRYILIRALYNSLGVDHNPYMKTAQTGNRWPIRVGVLYTLSLMAALIGLTVYQRSWLLVIVPFAFYVSAVTFYLAIPSTWFARMKLQPVFSPRSQTLQRITYVTLLFCSLTWMQYFTGWPMWRYFLMLWLLPIFTSFSLFMILRQIVQHGNGDRGWLTNTRVFLVHPLINYAVFPFGMDYHLPHHMFATVPHYRLPELHKVLSEYPEYQAEGVVVEGYFLPKHSQQTTPTVLDVLGPGYAPQTEHEAFIDDSVTEEWEGRRPVHEHSAFS